MRVSQRERKRGGRENIILLLYHIAIYEQSTTLMLQMLCFGKLPNCLSFDRRGERFLIINNFYKPSEPRHIYLLSTKDISESLHFTYYIILCRLLNSTSAIKTL